MRTPQVAQVAGDRDVDAVRGSNQELRRNQGRRALQADLPVVAGQRADCAPARQDCLAQLHDMTLAWLLSAS
jgi:hypothetical protein